MEPTRRRGKGMDCWTLARRLVTPAGLGGGGLLIGGCVAAAGVGAAVAVGLLTGLFLSRIQASFAATAHSYRYSEAGDAWLQFDAPHGQPPSFVGFAGRLPGFHLVIIDLDDKGMVRAQEDGPVIFETEVTIDLGQSPPAITGTIRERGGSQTFAFEELYPEVTDVSLTVGDPDARGRYRLELNIEALTADGETLDYSLIMRVRVSGDGTELSGSVEVERVVTPAGEEPIVVEGTGEVEGDQQPGDTLPTNGNDNEADEEQNDNAENQADNENDNAEEEPANDNADDLENDNQTGDEQNATAGDDQDDAGGEDVITAEACPGVPEAVIAFVNELIADIGFAGLDTDGSGEVTAAEVQEVVNPYITPLALTEEAATCIAAVVNG